METYLPSIRVKVMWCKLDKGITWSFSRCSHVIYFNIYGSFTDPYKFIKVSVTEKRVSAVEIVRNYQTPLQGSDIRIFHSAKIINLFCF